MKPRYNGRVRAQRKFAQGAVIPGTGSSTVTERRDPRPERAPDPIVQITQLPASYLLDVVAFKNIHNHYAGVREVRVVLDRLPSTEESITHTFPTPTTRAPKRTKNKGTLKNDVEQVKKARLSLRSRSISRDFNPLKGKKFRAAIEDNQPLRMLLNKKIQKAKIALKVNKNERILKKKAKIISKCNLVQADICVKSKASPSRRRPALRQVREKTNKTEETIGKLIEKERKISVPLSTVSSPINKPNETSKKPVETRKKSVETRRKSVETRRKSGDGKKSGETRRKSDESSKKSTESLIKSGETCRKLDETLNKPDANRTVRGKTRSRSVNSDGSAAVLIKMNTIETMGKPTNPPTVSSDICYVSDETDIDNDSTADCSSNGGPLKKKTREKPDKKSGSFIQFASREQLSASKVQSEESTSPSLEPLRYEEDSDENISECIQDDCVITLIRHDSRTARCESVDIQNMIQKMHEEDDEDPGTDWTVKIPEEQLRLTKPLEKSVEEEDRRMAYVNSPIIPQKHANTSRKEADQTKSPLRESLPPKRLSDDVYEFTDDVNAHVLPRYRPSRNDCTETSDANKESVNPGPNLTLVTERRPKSPAVAVGTPDEPLCVEPQAKKMDKVKTPRARQVSQNNEPSKSTSTPMTRTKTQLKSSESDTPSGACVREGKRFTPTPFEAENLIKYATKIKLQNPQMGICTVKLGESFKPPLITDDEAPSMKTSTQYINKMFQRWSPATRELLIIKCTQKQKMRTSPLFDGVELDLVNLYKYVQERDGLKNFLANNSWSEVISKLRLSSKGQPNKKLETLYFKYLLHYETLTYLEKEDILKRVEQCWEDIHKKHLERALRPLWRQERLMRLEPYNDDTPTDDIVQACIENDDCVAHYIRLCTLKQFRKIADRVRMVYLSDKLNHSVSEIENEYWRVVMLGTEHVSVNIASVDTSEHGHGFPADENAPYGNHPWNLKRVCQSRDNVLSFLPHTVGISAPSLHYGMVFTTSCWHMDPHMLPWVEYLHEGPPKIWYSVPESQSSNFRAAVSALCPTAVQNKSIWLPADITMIPPNLLQQHNVTLDRIVQYPGEFVIVYPNTYSASIDTGMTISEGTYFAPHSWLQNIEHIFKELRDNCEPSMFPMEQLLIGVARSENCPVHVLTQAHNALQPLIAAELRHRAAATQFGLKMLTPQQEAASMKRQRYKTNNECFYCRCTIHLSRVIGLTESGTTMCLEHGLRLFDKMKKKKMPETSTAYCVLHYSNEELDQIVTSLQKRITNLVSGWA